MVASHGFFGDFGQADAFDHALGSGEIAFDKFAGQAHCLENLGAAVGLVGGDAHFRHHLENAFGDGFGVMLVRFGLGEGLRRVGQAGGQGVEGQIGIDRFRAVTGQQTEVVNPLGFAGFDNQPDLGAQTGADQVMMNRSGGEQGGNGDVIRIQGAVGQNQDVVAAPHGVGGFAAQIFQSPRHAGRAAFDRVADAQSASAESAVNVVFDAADSLQVHIRQNRALDRQPLLTARAARIEQVGAGADEGHQRHHQRLADRVNGRIGNLGKRLFEVIGQQFGAVGQHRGRNVAAH